MNKEDIEKYKREIGMDMIDDDKRPRTIANVLDDMVDNRIKELALLEEFTKLYKKGEVK